MALELDQQVFTGETTTGSSGGGFDCNICLDTVHDPVVTLCGHLFCWPCIYKWLRFQSIDTKSETRSSQSCPVCKSEVAETSLVPLYGRGHTTTKTTTNNHHTSKSKSVPNLGIVVPRRPNFCSLENYSPRVSTPSPILSPSQSLYRGFGYGSSPRRAVASPGGIPGNLLDPTIGLYGEAVYARVFGNSITNLYTYPNSYNLAGNASPRIRRHVLEADRSLSRVCFFFFCCFVLCLLLF